ncbi:hypothetical protein ACTRXD_18710 [Nitrospira sp. T9]|jgi:hypothetical protein|uniref:Uncharacterized protein n=1 Tax=Candidatus Nitrospira allomarina TaxID=3020900 RepID=A0AA96G9X0_9BACT|nr:hypothetical protein [Candidatus Nitrospira allomarina]MCB9774068.1 hypothetical protein [Nitrospiraceae bacterium]WNM57407.1 hypothetical protein PP769_15750 [Candidatus Nitrospira allomarina]
MVWFVKGTLVNDREKTMHALGAATLSILPGIGHLYLGVKRGNIFLVCGILLLIISKFFWPTGWLIYMQFAILAGFDAFAFGKRGRGLF